MALMQSAAYLAYFAYIDDELAAPNPRDFEQLLATVPRGFANGPWTLTWGPAAYGGTLVYVARGADGTYAVAFRGTNAGYLDDEIRDLIDDFWYPPEDWPFAPGEGMKVCTGTSWALVDAIEARAASGSTLLAYLSDLVQESHDQVEIMVTGHSLGGTLAVVATAWLQAALPQIDNFVLVPKTFAAPTAWNGAFARWCEERFSYFASFNTYDVIPMMWTRIDDLLASYVDGPKLETFDKLGWDFFEAIRLDIAFERYDYVPVAPRFAFDFAGTLDPELDWFQNVKAMHSMRYQYFPHATGQTAPNLPHAKT